MAYNEVDEQIPSIAAETSARAPEAGAPDREARPAPGSRREALRRASARRRRRSRSRRHPAWTAAAAGLAEDRLLTVAPRTSPCCAERAGRPGRARRVSASIDRE